MEDNKLIAEFMGVNVITLDDVRKNKNPYFSSSDGYISSADGYLDDDLNYHTSWDWLMPVVERIENLGFEIIIAESRCRSRNNTDHSIKELFHSETLSSKIDSTYDVVVQFIKQIKQLNN